jgi:hypothetical protein
LQHEEEEEQQHRLLLLWYGSAVGSASPASASSSSSSSSGRPRGFRGLALVLLGFVFLGIGGSFLYGDADLGSLTRTGSSASSGNAFGYIPIALGIVLIIVGLVLLVIDRRAA